MPVPETPFRGPRNGVVHCDWPGNGVSRLRSQTEFGNQVNEAVNDLLLQQLESQAINSPPNFMASKEEVVELAPYEADEASADEARPLRWSAASSCSG